MKKILSKKEDCARKWRAFKRHVRLMIQPLLIATLVALYWRLAWSEQWLSFICKEDVPLVMGTAFSMLMLAYSITAGLIFNSSWRKYNKVMGCVLPQDKRTFLLYRDEKMPLVIHLFLGSLSFLLLAVIGLLPYEDCTSGTLAVFLATFIMALVWVVLIQLENPTKSAWLAERLPREWLKEDVDEYFRLENGDNGKEEK
jgi:FtsH-binding integral membrane protein